MKRKQVSKVTRDLLWEEVEMLQNWTQDQVDPKNAWVSTSNRGKDSELTWAAMH